MNSTGVPGLRVVGIFVSPGHNYFGHHEKPAGVARTISVGEVECVAGRGLSGERFFGFQDNYKGQVAFFAADVFDEICCQLGLGGRSSGVTRRNIFTGGVDLNLLVGQKFSAQSIEFEGVSECSPGHWMNEAIASGAEALVHGRGGLRARILSDGVLRVDVERASDATSGGNFTEGMPV